MSSVQPQLDYLMAYWNKPCVITYPIPPYLTLRMNIDFHQGPPFPRPRLLLNKIRKFSSAKDGRYSRPDGEEDMRLPGRPYEKEKFAKEIVYRKTGSDQTSQIYDARNKLIDFFFWDNPQPGQMAFHKQNSEERDGRYYRPDGEEVLRLPGREVYRKRTSQTSQIHDDPSYWLMATHKQNSDGAKFVITIYGPQYITIPVTLKIEDRNLYLACINGVLTLEDPNDNGETLDTIQGSTKRFLFLRPRPNGQIVTFESVMSPKMFISTDMSETSPVEMSKSSDQAKIVGFFIDKEVRSFNRVRNNNRSMQAPMEIPECLQEYNQQLGNTYERFTYRPYGILGFGRLDI
ncbi:uncharacterized protein LOC120933040 [Rana temporaria]|uniref:uncharacterized protein LOC120933040 n=1 Tax=Rana temporaria TaxID=8407 RepID=UPI001AAD1D0C|nr:uncharacterized protein LOC120933040 [Rana temporaria]